MELELGLKITHTRDDITSTADFRLNKDPFGPVFLSRETDQMFILIAHLKGFRKENIFIEINKDGNRIAISGEKPVEEKMMIGWIMCKKEVEIKGFRKVFRIPDVVDLERIKAKYNEQESTLKIVMKKKVKGMFGVSIEEENEQQQEEEEKAEEVPKVDTKEPEKVPKAEFLEKKEPEKVPKVEDKIQSNEEIEQRQVEKQSTIETETEEFEAEEEAGEKPGEVLEAPEEKIAPTFSEPEIMGSDEVVEPRMTEMTSIEEPEEEEEPPDEIQKIPEAVEEPEEEEEEEEVIPSLPPISQDEEDERIANEDDQAQDERLMEEYESGGDDQEQAEEDESDSKKESHENVEGEIEEEQEETDDQEEEHHPQGDDTDASPEIDGDKEPIEGASMEPKEEEKRKKSKLRKPLMFAGSAFLVSLIVLVINLLRARKR